ncbi:MAG: response regulator transcription factor [Acidimicrobiia bacterium]
MTSSVLVVEDDPTIGPALEQALALQGYAVTLAPDGRTARIACEVGLPDLVLLDLGLPDVEGVDLCRELRHASASMAIVVLTARGDEADVVMGLDAGADDYVTKPFRLAELLARVRVHLRRPEQTPDAEGLDIGDLRIDLAARRVWVGDHEVTLRAREHDLLVLLACEAGKAVTRERIMDEVWSAEGYESTKTLDTHVSALRRKLGEHDSLDLPRIVALPRVGYRLDVP